MTISRHIAKLYQFNNHKITSDKKQLSSVKINIQNYVFACVPDRSHTGRKFLISLRFVICIKRYLS